MKILKSLTLSLMSFLLFVSLSVFGLAYAAEQTVLDREFVVSQVSRLDVSGLLKDMVGKPLGQQLTQAVGQQIPGARERVAGVMDATIAELDPWLKKQSGDLTLALYDYVTGRTATLDVKVSLNPMRDALRKNLRWAIGQAPELAQVPAAQRDALADGMVQQLTQQLPATFDLLQSAGPDFRNALDGIRLWLSYFSLAYWGLVVLMLLLVAGVVLVLGNAKDATRNLGFTLFSFGAFEYVGILVTGYFTNMQISSIGVLPAALENWLPQFLNRLWAPVEVFSIVVGVGGLVLLAISLFLKRPVSRWG